MHACRLAAHDTGRELRFNRVFVPALELTSPDVLTTTPDIERVGSGLAVSALFPPPRAASFISNDKEKEIKVEPS